jgi:cation transport protein ChaC
MERAEAHQHRSKHSSTAAVAGDPAGLQRMLDQLAQGRPLQLFAYGSLIWRPDFDCVAMLPARVHGYHRTLRMRSNIYRGTDSQPGLVLALIPGGSCDGVLYRIAPDCAADVLRQVWAREMVSGVYLPRWLACRGRDGAPLGTALAFTLPRRSPSLVRPLADEELLRVLRHARGRYGSTLEYLRNTVASLREHGIHDRDLERQCALAMHHGLCDSLPPAQSAARRRKASAGEGSSPSTAGSSTSTPCAG